MRRMRSQIKSFLNLKFFFCLPQLNVYLIKYLPQDAQTISVRLIPVESLDVVVGVLIQLADPAVDILWDVLIAGGSDGLLHSLFQQHVLVRMLLQHPLQEQRSPRLFELCPVLLAGIVELELVGHVPDRLDVQPRHLCRAAPMNATVVQEQVELVLVA